MRWHRACEALRSKGGESLLATQWLERYESCIDFNTCFLVLYRIHAFFFSIEQIKVVINPNRANCYLCIYISYLPVKDSSSLEFAHQHIHHHLDHLLSLLRLRLSDQDHHKEQVAVVQHTFACLVHQVLVNLQEPDE